MTSVLLHSNFNLIEIDDYRLPFDLYADQHWIIQLPIKTSANMTSVINIIRNFFVIFIVSISIVLSDGESWNWRGNIRHRFLTSASAKYSHDQPERTRRFIIHFSRLPWFIHSITLSNYILITKFHLGILFLFCSLKKG